MDIRFVWMKHPHIITRLLKYVHDIHVEKNPDIYNPYNYDDMLPVITNILDDDKKFCVVAYVNDEPAGYALLIQRDHPWPFFRKEHRSIYIDQMCVIKKYRNQGLGTKMFDFITSFCKEKKIYR
ncbi:MAG: GNAT family N-acetyltransferase, partial [Spirochaetales bacterium]|nr:GNAT family N-acetyltransferase [Spirochaetales bacterium]